MSRALSMSGTGTSVVPMRLNLSWNGITKTTRLSGFCRIQAWPCECTFGTTMWLPFTRRTRPLIASPSMRSSASITQGPAVLTSARARSIRVSPRASRTSASQAPSTRRARSKRVRTWIEAPLSRADIAFTSVRRASSTRQSE
jgi:hypothetical protein